MKVLILGAGAVGLSVAAKLSRVCEVFAVTKERYASAIASGGFHLSGIWGEGDYSFPVNSVLPPSMAFDYVIVTAKSGDTETVCRAWAPALKDTEAVSLQNGIGNEEILSKYAARVIGGTIITGFEWRGDAAVKVSVEAGAAKLGRYPEGLDPSVTRLVDIFAKAGIKAEGSRSIRSELWAKTLYNCSLNPLGALMGVPYGLLAAPPAWRIIDAIVREGFAVVKAEGLSLPWPKPEDFLDYLRDVQLPATAAHRSSMLQDIERGKPTEIEFLNGAIVSAGARHNIATPINATIVNLVRFKECLPAKAASS